MKGLMVFILVVCPVFMVFAQDPNATAFRDLSSTMGTSISSSNSTLGSLDQKMTYNANFVTYTSYKTQHDSLVKSLRESEARLNKLITNNAPESTRKEERDTYERLIKKLESVKAEYDSWLQSVR